jgi:magnesium and cobalt transporter
MNDASHPPERSWLERLGQVFFGEPKTREDIVELLREAEQRSILDNDVLNMIEGVLAVSNMQVRDIMIPRAEMVVVAHDAKLPEFAPSVIESGHSRFPVVGDDPDKIVGILLAKDLLPHLYSGEVDHFNMQAVLRPVIFVPESKRLNMLLKEFRSKRQHMAIVVDEYGRVYGLITIEDVLEQIVGKIEDEFDIDEESDIKKHSDNLYTLTARTSISQFNEQFGTQFSDEQFDTIGGLVIHALGHVPQRNESVTLDHITFKVLQSDRRHIRTLQAEVKPESLTPAND